MSSLSDHLHLIPLANRILVRHEVLDAYGHVSMRDPEDPNFFYISRNLAPERVQAEDVQRFSIDGTTTDTRKPYLEVFIHSEVYRKRPDVNAVVHSHSAPVVPFSISKRPMPCVSHMAGFLAGGTPVFEIRDVVGDGSDLLITNPTLGAALADALHDASVALLRGHGAIVVGESIPEVVHRSIFTVFNAKITLEAAKLGDFEELTEAEGLAAMTSNQTQIERAWGLWAHEAQ